jgi:hypothetical protein
VNEGETEYMKCGSRKTIEHKLERETTEFENAQVFKFLGSVVNQNNETEEAEEIINARNKALYANKKMYQCKLPSKGSKRRLCW